MHIYTYTLCIYTGLNNAHVVAVAPRTLPVRTRRSLGFCLEPSSGRMETDGADIYRCINININICVCVCVCVYTPIKQSVYLSIYLPICSSILHIYLSIYIYIYIHAHIYIYTMYILGLIMLTWWQLRLRCCL